jgi:hypothetical protein
VHPPVAHVDPNLYFEVDHVDVDNGIATAGPLPQSQFFEWRNPYGGRDLLVFVGHAQPTSGGWRLCKAVIEYAAGRGVREFFTFAAMADQLTLGVRPRVLAAATEPGLLARLVEHGVEPLERGPISGPTAADDRQALAMLSSEYGQDVFEDRTRLQLMCRDLPMASAMYSCKKFSKRHLRGE